jgi:hypothetical protein
LLNVLLQLANKLGLIKKKKKKENHLGQGVVNITIPSIRAATTTTTTTTINNNNKITTLLLLLFLQLLTILITQ